MVKGHRVEKIVDIDHFVDMVKGCGTVNCTHHTFFRLSEKQRKLFKCREIEKYLLGIRPVLVGQQFNGLFSCFYRYSGKHL